eukprot:TRINITY_DN540_c1_g2_i1.p1 TRINITY_DN540_c1_g2~~TRINITY_DN540_c1_g2_i1.p1  ORF type:complete len:599 (+),score=118.25 TRINITY_DN540_c1_g2_i1:25-1797(+)
MTKHQLGQKCLLLALLVFVGLVHSIRHQQFFQDYSHGEHNIQDLHELQINEYPHSHLNNYPLDKTLKDRDWFYIILNMESNVDKYAQIPALVHSYLEPYNYEHDDNPILDVYKYHYFDYSIDNLNQRLDDIYNMLYNESEAYDPAKDTIFKTKEDVVERLFQFSPYNLLDGAWLRYITPPGPISNIHNYLFSIWMDEAGNGSLDKNHARMYQNTLKSIGVTLPPVNSHEFAYNPDIIDSAYSQSTYALAISQMGKMFFPEIVGMTLQLEWEVLALKPVIKLLKYHGIDTSYYDMHVAIDNAVNGHGFKAKKLVIEYMDQVRKIGGEELVQKIWKRIWNGYITFTLVGGFFDDLEKLITHKYDPHEEMVKMILRKSKYGSKNHNDRTMGGKKINDLFADPELFLSLISKSGLIDPDNVENSNIFKTTTSDGKMYGVFSDYELKIWKDWIKTFSNNSDPDTDTGSDDSDTVEDMKKMIDAWRERQDGVFAHAGTELTGPFQGSTTTESVQWWFEQESIDMMGALANWDTHVVCGSADKSEFMKMITSNSAMANEIKQEERKLAAKWIDEGCPLENTKYVQLNGWSWSPHRRG